MDGDAVIEYAVSRSFPLRCNAVGGEEAGNRGGTTEVSLWVAVKSTPASDAKQS